jgi:hypothetical protein
MPCCGGHAYLIDSHKQWPAAEGPDALLVVPTESEWGSQVALSRAVSASRHIVVARGMEVPAGGGQHIHLG